MLAFVERAAGAALLADVEIGGDDERRRAGWDDGRVVHARPIAGRALVADLDVEVGWRGRGVEDVGLEEVVAGPVLRAVPRDPVLVDTERPLAVGGVLLSGRGRGVGAEGLDRAVFEAGEGADRRAGRLRNGGEGSAAGVALAPRGHVAVTAIGAANGLGGIDRAGRGERLLLLSDDRAVGERRVGRYAGEFRVVDPEAAGRPQTDARDDLLAGGDVLHDLDARPAEGAGLLERVVLVIDEADVFAQAPGVDADVEPADVAREAVASGVDGDRRRVEADLAAEGADHLRAGVAGTGDLAVAELDRALEDPAGPLGERYAELVPGLSLLDGRIGEKVLRVELRGEKHAHDKH